jgi:hypothetical protein
MNIDFYYGVVLFGGGFFLLIGNVALILQRLERDAEANDTAD